MSQRGDIPINNFVKGLVTEASPLTFPPGASLDEVNFELLRDGSRRRRLGLDLEDGYGLLSSGLDSAVLEGARCQAYRWSIPNGHIDQDIGVIQIGNQIWFIDLYTANPSANILNGGNPIVATELNNDVIMTFTTLNNYLIGVANHLPQPYLFNYDPATDTVTVETAAIAIRDMWGVDDGLAVDGRPTALTPAHHYNLLNQGWLPDIQSTCGAGINAIDCTFNTFGIYPSNSDAWTYGRVEDLTSVDVKKFDPDIAGRNFVNNGNVARGHFIISLYERGVSRSNQTGFTLPVDRETGRINAIAAFAGRIFYAGILSKVVGGDSRSPNLSGTVLFSQLFENKLNLVKCYQEADPTSPDINDIVDTDGGLIQIPECGYIWALKAIKESLFVFASNGVWEIRGGDNGFTATSFMVYKISNVGVYAPKSIVEVEGIIYFWAATGIHAIGRNENGVFQTTNLTIPTIQTLYNAIPDASKKNARGYYDLAQNRARWLYYSPETKEFGEAIDIDEVPLTGGAIVNTSSTITSAISAQEPKITRLTDTTAVVVYRNSVSTAMYGRVLTLSGGVVSVGAENTIFTGVAVTGIGITRLTDTKVLVGYQSGNDLNTFVINVSGSTLTKGTTYVPDTSSFSTAYDRPVRLATVSSGRAIVTAGDTNTRVSLQVLDIDASDVITWGTKEIAVGNTNTKWNVSLLTSTTGYVIANNSSNRNTLQHFTISGTSITLGTKFEFPTVTQLPGTSYSTLLPYVVGRNSSSLVMTTMINITTPTKSNYLATYVVTDNATTPESTSILVHDDEGQFLSTSHPVMVINGFDLIQIVKSGTASARVILDKISGTTITYNSGFDLDTPVSSTSFSFQEVARMSGNKLLIVYEAGSNKIAVSHVDIT